MFSKASRNLLQYVLWADAISCLACGALQVFFTASLAQYFGLPRPLLTDTGWFLLVYGAVVAVLALRARAPAALIRLLIAGNVSWAVAAVVILLGVDMPVTLLGKAYIIVQALTVLILARLQYQCLHPGKANGLASARQQSTDQG